MNDLFRTILVPHDLSAHANDALEMAARLAGTEGRLVVLHVANEYGNVLVQKRAIDEARRALERLVGRTLASRGGPLVECRVEAGDPYREISEAARGVDSILMCTAGRTGLQQLLIGSVAEKVVRHAPVPVLTFRPGARTVKHGFRSVLVPHDFSRHAGRALKLAARLAGPDGRLVVLHVAAGLPDLATQVRKRITSDAHRRLERLATRLAAKRNAPAIECRVEAGDPYRHIVGAARGADLIVMCTAGRTGLPHLVIGSVAEKVVRHAPVPVLTIRPARARTRKSLATRMRAAG